MSETEDMDDSIAAATEQPDRLTLPALDFRAVRDLVALAIDPKMVKRNLRSLHDALAATTAAQRQLESDRAEHDAQLAKDRAELAAERDVLMKRRLAVHQAEASLAERSERIGKLERAWRNLGEPDSVISGFQSPQYSGLEKARRAHRGEPITEPSPPSGDAVARAGATIDEDPQGNKFPKHVSLTMTRPPEEPGARVRGRRGAATAGA
jgi:hypothetical protein